MLEIFAAGGGGSCDRGRGLHEFSRSITKAGVDRIDPVERMLRCLGFRLRHARRLALARRGVVSAGIRHRGPSNPPAPPPPRVDIQIK